MLLKKAFAEGIGTLVLVVLGCGVAIATNVNIVATALAFGLSIVAMAFSIGNISGCHINPAVSLAMLLTKKMTLKEFFVYVGSQIVGAIVGALLLYVIFLNAGSSGFISAALDSLGSNTVNQTVFGSNTGGLFLGFLVETVLSFVFVIAILGVTSKVENKTVTGVVIGLTLSLVHLMGIPLTGTSVNPARSIGPALIAMINGQFEPIKQIWIFIVAPLIGAAIAALVYSLLSKAKSKKVSA